jgi:nitrogen fixation NifU-like protein
MPYYSKQVLDHFLHPKHLGRFDNPDGVGDTENLKCGDIMKIYIKVAKKNNQEYIKDIRFETMGCGTAIASSDMICQLAKGKTLSRAKKIKFQDVADKLGALPPQKIHCAHLAETALKSAIDNYEKKKK